MKSEIHAHPSARPAAEAASCSARLFLTEDDNTGIEVRRALAKQKNGLLPRVISLPRLAAAAEHVPEKDAPKMLVETAHLAETADKRDLRMRKIYDALRKQDAHRVSMTEAETYANVFHEFLEECEDLVPDSGEFEARCKKAAELFEGESQLLAELWKEKKEDLLKPRRALAAFAADAPSLAYVGEQRGWIKGFLQQCAGGCEAFELERQPELFYALSGEKSEWKTDIASCAEGEAPTLGAAANLAMAAVRELKQSGKKRIGIVAYDRLLARRLRAIAESDGLIIADRGGWRVETLAFGGALLQWMHTVLDFSIERFGSILAAPYWAGDSEQQRTNAMAAWQKLLGEDKMLPQNWKDFGKFDGEDFYFVAERMLRAMPRHSTRQPLSDWAAWLIKESAEALAAWKDDPVAADVRANLFQAAEGGQDMDAKEFRAWLGFWMRTETAETVMTEDAPDGVSFVPQTARQRFDALILLGASERSLPAPIPSLLGDKWREAMEFPSREEIGKRDLARFSRLVDPGESDPKDLKLSAIAAVWRSSESDGRLVSPSPFWQLLKDELQKRGVCTQKIETPPLPEPAKGISPPKRAESRISASELPKKIYVTNAERLMECPYKFFAEAILQLNDREGSETMDPLARGSLLHKALEKFSKKSAGKQTKEELENCWIESLNELPVTRTGAALERARWKAQYKQFIESEMKMREEGWNFQKAEFRMSTKVKFPDGKEVEVSGRIDRIDRHEKDGAWMVTDYKSGAGPSKKEMETGEKPQLPLYAWLLAKYGVDELKPNSSKAVEWHVSFPAGNYKNVQTQGDPIHIVATLYVAIRHIANGEAMLACGAPDVCEKCSARRLCRKDHWIS